MRHIKVLVAGLSLLTAGGLLGFTLISSASPGPGLSMAAGETDHVICAGPSLAVSGQTATALDLTCAANPTTTTTAPTTTTTAPPPSPLAVDTTVTGEGVSPSTVNVTATAGDVLVAFAASDGPGAGGQTVTVAGAGLVWNNVTRANGRPGDVDIWSATNGPALSAAAVTATGSVAGFQVQLTVVAYKGSGGIGASATKSSAPAAETISLAAQTSGSLVSGVGFDWDAVAARTVPAGQTMVAQNLVSGVGTMWVQKVNAATTAAGQLITVNDTAPASSQYDMAAVEVKPATAPPPPTTTTVPATTTTTVLPGAFPTAATTGVPSGTVLKPWDNHTVIAGEMIDGWDIPGGLNVNGLGVTIKNSHLHGTGTTGSDFGIQNCCASTPVTTIDRVEIDHFGYGVGYGAYTLTNSYIHDVGDDGLKLGDNTNVTGNYIRPNGYAAGAHQDCGQMQSGVTTLTIRHNNLDGCDNSALFIAPDQGNGSGTVTIDNNLLGGGHYSLNLLDGGGTGVYTQRGINVVNNHFLRDATYGPVNINMTVPYTSSGNVWDDTGQPIPGL